MNGLGRLLVRGVDLVNRRGKSVGVRLVKLTGKRPYAIHPKHLVDHPWHDWYVPYLDPADFVLDVGCSNGAHLARAATACRSIVGFDHDLPQLAIAGRTIREKALARARVFAWDITGAFPFRRVLKDDGRLLVSGPNRESSWRRTLREAGLFAYSDPDHKIEYTREEFLDELRQAGFEPAGPVVLDTPWAGVIDAVGGLSLSLYDRLSRWKRDAALRRPDDSTGFRVVARKRP